MKLARTIRLDQSDANVFEVAAESGEWAISGGFEFSNWTDQDLTGKRRQAFANGWLSLESFGRATFVAVTQIEPEELEKLADALAAHFVHYYGAPDAEAALGVARGEIDYMQELCEEHEPNTLLAVSRELSDGGIREQFRFIEVAEASLDMIAVHGEPD